MSVIGWLAEKRSPTLPFTYPLHVLAYVFNNCFLQKVQSIRADLGQQLLSLTSFSLTDQQADSNLHWYHPITEAELKITILKSKPTSCSLDPLPTSLLEFLDDLLPTLMNNMNSSLSSGAFPSTFRSAVVKPLLKKASLDPNNLKKLSACLQTLFHVKNHRKDCHLAAVCLLHWAQSHLSFSSRLPPSP